MTSRDGTRVRAWSSSRRSAASKFRTQFSIAGVRRLLAMWTTVRATTLAIPTCHAPKSAQGISARHGVRPWQSQARPAISARGRRASAASRSRRPPRRRPGQPRVGEQAVDQLRVHLIRLRTQTEPAPRHGVRVHVLVAPCGSTGCVTPASIAVSVEPAPPWCTSAAQVGSSADSGTHPAARTLSGSSPVATGPRRRGRVRTRRPDAVPRRRVSVNDVERADLGRTVPSVTATRGRAGRSSTHSGSTPPSVVRHVPHRPAAHRPVDHALAAPRRSTRAPRETLARHAVRVPRPSS